MRRRCGFTLIELLVVIVIIAVLAAIGIGRFWRTKERAYIAAMQTELRTLIPAQELYRSDSARYTTVLSELTVRSSRNVHLSIEHADRVSWHAIARHDATTLTCTVRGGSLGNEVTCP